MLINEDELIVIIGLIIVIFFIIYLVGFIFRATADDYPDTCKYVEPRDFNNGDLVFVSYETFAGAIVTSFSGSIWSHTGTIWVEPETNIRYVLEGAIYRHLKYRHFFKIPLETWLFFNKKFLVGYKKYLGPKLDSKFMWQKFEWLHKNCKLEAFNVFWSRFLVNRDYYEYSRLPKYTCLEATVILGQDIGIYAKDKIYCSYFPGNLVNDEIKYENGVSYGKMVKISLYPTNLLILNEDLVSQRSFWKN